MENVFYFGNRTMIIIIISLACKWEPGKTVRYHHLNDVIARSLASAGVPVSKEPQGLSRFDGKRPDGLTLIRACLSYGIWQCLTQLRIPTWKLLLARQALQPSWQHLTRWSHMLDCHHRVNSSRFWRESHGPINRDALQFLCELGRRLVETTRDVRASSFLFQQISVVVQRFNSVLLHDGFVDDHRPE